MCKKRVVVLVIIAWSCANVSALGFLGPPTAELEQGQVGLGYSFAYIDMDLDSTHVVETDYVDGVFDTVDPPGRMRIKDFKVLRHYATISYAILRNWEAYLQLGVADVKLDRWYLDAPVWKGMNFDNDFAWGWGTRVTFYERPTVSWGASVQMNWLDTDWDGMVLGATPDLDETRDLNIETYDLLIAVGPTFDLDSCKVYGGPFYYYLSGDYKMVETGVFEGTPWTDIGRADLRAESIGGFIGCQIALTENIQPAFEFSFTGDGWGIGAGATYRF